MEKKMKIATFLFPVLTLVFVYSLFAMCYGLNSLVWSGDIKGTFIAVQLLMLFVSASINILISETKSEAGQLEKEINRKIKELKKYTYGKGSNES